VVTSLAVEKLTLALRAALYLAALRVGLRLVPLDTLQRVAARLAPRRADPERVAWCVSGVGRRLGASCLAQALAARALLPDSTVRIGVGRENGVIKAHAWLERGGRAIVGQPQYRPLS